jgi:hypothetical protein
LATSQFLRGQCPPLKFTQKYITIDHSNIYNPRAQFCSRPPSCRRFTFLMHLLIGGGPTPCPPPEKTHALTGHHSLRPWAPPVSANQEGEHCFLFLSGPTHRSSTLPICVLLIALSALAATSTYVMPTCLVVRPTANSTHGHETCPACGCSRTASSAAWRTPARTTKGRRPAAVAAGGARCWSTSPAARW